MTSVNFKNKISISERIIVTFYVFISSEDGQTIMFCLYGEFKGTVHSKIKLHPFSTHHYVDEGSGGIFKST